MATPILPAGGQTVYRGAMRPAVPGMIADIQFMKDIVTATPGAEVQQVSTVTVNVATNAATDTITVNEVPFAYVVQVTDTVNSIAIALAALINADAIQSQIVVATVSTANVIISALVPGTAFTCTVTNTHGGDLTLVATVANQTTAPIYFGQGVVFVTYASALNDHQIGLPFSAGSITGTPGFLGVAVQQHIQQQLAYQNPLLTPGLNVYNVNDVVPVLRKGRIWVPIEAAVNPSLPVYLRFTANVAGFGRTSQPGTGLPGSWNVAADGAKCQQITTAAWVATATLAQGVGLLQLN